MLAPSTTSPIRLALIEDDPRVRELLSSYLCRQPELECVMVAGSVEAALAELPDLVALPQVLLLDIGLPGMSGLDALPIFRARLPDTEILMQTVFEDPDRIYLALCRGAGGYVLKNTPLPEVKAAILEVMRGGAPMSRSVARKVLAHFKPTPSTQGELLSQRERSVLEGLVDGLTEKQVAIRLDLSPQTIHGYVKQVYRKLEINSRGELMKRASRGEL